MKHIGNKTPETIKVDLVDSDTGECYGDTEIEPGGRLDINSVTAEQELCGKLPTKNFNKDEPFTKMYCNAFALLVDRLTYSEISFFMGMCKYIGYGDCIVRTSADNRGTKVDGRKKLAKLLGVTEASCYKHIAALEDKEVLKIRKDGSHRYFVINPFICFRGRNLDVDTFLEFYDTQWAKCSLDGNGDR